MPLLFPRHGIRQGPQKSLLSWHLCSVVVEVKFALCKQFDGIHSRIAYFFLKSTQFILLCFFIRNFLQLLVTTDAADVIKRIHVDEIEGLR